MPRSFLRGSSIPLLVVTVVIITIMIVSLIVVMTLIALIVFILTSAANLLWIMGPRQVGPGTLFRLRVYPNIALVPVIISVLIISLVGVEINCLRECRHDHYGFSAMMVSADAYSASSDHKR